MGERFHDILILLSFLIEVVVLLYVEMKAWKTLYTPLIFLMLPYTVILLITILVSGNMNFVEFYYPSIFLWSVGLLIFAIPSFGLAFIAQKHNVDFSSRLQEPQMPRLLGCLSLFLIVLFIVRLKTMLGGGEVVGSEEFGEKFCGFGFWGHLRQLSMPLLIVAIYFVDSKNKWLWLIIIPILVINFLYLVKGWIIIPCLAGLSLRLFLGKTKLRLSLLFSIILGALLVFLGTYILILAISRDREVNGEILSFIVGHFIHYLTSGTLGLSSDALAGFPDSGSFENLWIPIINIINVVSGQGELMSPINPLYYNTGLNLTNVRTFFGTIYIYSSYLEFVVYILLSSAMMYLLKLSTMKWQNIYMYVIYFFECGLLSMGWFEFYYFHLAAFEVPVMALLLWGVDWVCQGRYVQVLNEA